MDRMTLFDIPASSSRSDPVTSHLAAADLTASGERDRQCAEVLAAVRKYPLMTSRELGEAAGLDRHAVARRLSDLMHAGRVERPGQRKCRASGKLAMVWRAVD